MADELRYIGLDTQSGLTLTAQIYGEDGVQVGASISVSEVGSTSIYTGDMPAVGAATYSVRFFNGSTVLGVGEIEWDGTQEVTARDLAASIAALNDFDPASDTVARVTLVDTVTANTDMRGTDGANTTAPNTVAPDNASIAAILADTNELQSNQASFATATGFATAADIASALASYDGPTKAELDASEAAIIAALPTPDEMTAAELHTALDSYTNKDDWKADVSGISVDAASIYTYFTASNREDAFKADVSGLATGSAISSLNDISAADVYSYFTLGSNEDAFKADSLGGSVDLTPVLSAIAALNDFNPASDTVARVTLVDTTAVNSDMRGTDNAFLASSFVAPYTPTQVYAEFTSGSNADAFKSNVTDLAKAYPTAEFTQ